MHHETSYIESNFNGPLGKIGQYTFCPLGHCGEDQIARLVSKVVVRGNPLLQGRRQAELMTLGRAIYRKSLPLGLSQVVMYKGKPVALNTAWDHAEGGEWEDSELAMPEGLGAHAAVAKACFNALPADDTPTLYNAFAGVLAPHSGKLFAILALTGQMLARAMGFEKSFGYTIFSDLMKRAKGHGGAQRLGPVKFVDIATEDEVVRAELAELDGVAQVSVMHTDYTTGPAYMDVMAQAVRATPEELLVPSRELALKQVERLRRRHSGIISSNL